MAWMVPRFDKKAVDEAGGRLAQLQFPVVTISGLATLGVINNWRASHQYPLNTFQITLRNKARRIERDAIVAQRTKRLESIHSKLARQPSMRMSQMQDIAGCRAVLQKMTSVRRLIQKYRTSDFDHMLKGEKDYITNPKPDGYRCYHLVYEYRGWNDTAVYTGMRVEIQIRTAMQHAWATAVEAVGIFTKQALKSNQGDSDWLRFFALMGAVIAALEQCNPVPNTPHSKPQLSAEIERLANKLHARQVLAAYNTSIEFVGAAKDVKYFVLKLELEPPRITAWRYKAKESQIANDTYTRLESEVPEGSSDQIVLVSVDSVAALKRAYPNYFLDTNKFLGLVERAIRSDFPDPLLHQTIAAAA